MKKIYSHKPSGWPGELWRESLPTGNGLTGALVSGGAGTEHIWLNRFDRWEGERDTLPDVHEAFLEQRRLVRAGDFAGAKWLLSDALKEAGCKGACAVPSKPVYLRLVYDQKQPFADYTRGIDMESACAYVTFRTGENRQRRQAYVSRADDVFRYSVSMDAPVGIKLYRPDSDEVHFAFDAGGASVTEYPEYILIEGCTRLCLACAFGKQPATDGWEAALQAHTALLPEMTAELNLSDTDSPNEKLLDAAAGGASPELIEKLWRFGRYLFASGTAAGGSPFPLYGLWHGIKNPQWAQNVANENVQMIYWHAAAGGLSELVKPLIHYYYKQMPDARENAMKLFGCRGICVSVYSTPVSGLIQPIVPVITNFTGCAGWLSRHFWEYWRFTRDDELLEAEILPFMLEAALFYEDYAGYDESGKLCLEPSVSPENTPSNLMPPAGSKPMGHPNPVVRNSVIELSILRELLTHLIELNSVRPLDPDRVNKWKRMLAAMPDHAVNADGAVKEWTDERLMDNYRHRHLSHIYPLFPGEEIRRGAAGFEAFERAVDLRELGAQSGWSLAHMAAIYARMGRGESAFECLNTLARSCVLGNFFTLHNDWRDMSLTLNADSGAPVQLDALMGIVNAVQEMLLRQDGDTVLLLPACPESLAKGEFKGFRTADAALDVMWDTAAEQLSVKVTALRETSFRLRFPAWLNRADAEVVLKHAGDSLIL